MCERERGGQGRMGSGGRSEFHGHYGGHQQQFPPPPLAGLPAFSPFPRLRLLAGALPSLLVLCCSPKPTLEPPPMWSTTLSFWTSIGHLPHSPPLGLPP